MQRDNKLSRRQFLKGTAALGAAVAAPMIIPASALGRGGKVAPSERIIMGGIGLGGRGTFDLNAFLHESDVQYVAVCEVQKSRRDTAKETIDKFYKNKDAATYRDLRELLAREDLDAVTIATGDRWHTPAAIAALKSGRDVYCEKPASLSIAEGQALVEAGRRYGRIFQSGIQRLSEANFIIAGELLRTGRLGKVHTVYAHLWNTPTWPRKNVFLPGEPEPEKDVVDWDLWTGPSPMRAYNSNYCAKNGWYKQPDYANGIAQWGSHTICQCQMDMDLGETSAIEYIYPKEAGGDAEGISCLFANGVKLVMSRNGWKGSCGIKYVGDEGWVAAADGYERPEVSKPSLLSDSAALVASHIARTGHPVGHHRDFLDGVRARRRCIANEVVAHRTMVTNQALDICMDLKRNVKWDPAKEEFIGDDEANRLRSRAMRSPWSV